MADIYELSARVKKFRLRHCEKLTKNLEKSLKVSLVYARNIKIGV